MQVGRPLLAVAEQYLSSELDYREMRLVIEKCGQGVPCEIPKYLASVTTQEC